MTNQIRTINLILITAGFAISLIGLFQVWINRNIEKKTGRFIAALFSVLSLYIIFILIRELIYFKEEYFWVLLSRSVMFGQALMAPLLMVILTAFLLYKSGEERWMNHMIFDVSVALCIVYTALLIYNIFSGKIYYIDPENEYRRGPLFPVLVLPTLIISCVNLYTLWYRRKSLRLKQRQAFLVFSIVPMIAMIVQSRFFGIHIIALSTVISAAFLLVYIISDQTERYYIKEAENAKLKLDILLGQIQPHFMYNSLTTIKHLVATDSEKAQEAMDDFILYLRYNMDSMTADKPIPFEQELNHVKGYIDLQKLRFGNDLSVEYNIEFTDFKMPTLTLQPLVENAVTYGVRKKSSGKGTVTITSKRVEDHVEVTVEDDGPGFVLEKAYENKEKSHVGIMNVKERVESVVGGELIIDSVMGRGTKATIKLALGEE